MPQTEKKNASFQIGIYMVEKTIGQGTYGKVKEGYQIYTREKVAVKIIEKQSIENERQVKRIQKEIRFLKLLTHPHIVKVYDVLETDGEIYIVMEYAAGGELFDYIVKFKRVKEKEARNFFRQIVSAVDYCHQNSVIHRDLKPENLLLDEKRRIKIIDFGFSNTYVVDSLLSTFCGSPFYAAPEMILGKKYEGPEVDIWSLGVILFALLCGHLPFDDDEIKELYKKISAARYTTPDYMSKDAKNLVSRMITVHPKRRATLEEIKNHVWLNEGYSGPPESLVEPRLPLNIDDLNLEAKDKLLTFGYTEQQVMENLIKDQPNPVKNTYYLVLEMFIRENEKQKARRLGDKSKFPSMGTISEKPDVSSQSEPLSPSAQYTKMYQDLKSMPEMAISEEPSPEPEKPAVQPNMGRRASVAVVTPATIAAHANAAPLFPNKNKEVEPSAPAKPAPNQGRRLSLPAIEYSQKRSEQLAKGEVPGQMRTISGWFTSSTTSNKMPSEISIEIEKVLNANNLTFAKEGFSYICEDPNRKSPIAFEIEICKVVRLSMFGLHLKRIRGSVWNYKKLANKLLSQMTL